MLMFFIVVNFKVLQCSHVSQCGAVFDMFFLVQRLVSTSVFVEGKSIYMQCQNCVGE